MIVRLTSERDLILHLDQQCFPTDDPPQRWDAAWIVKDGCMIAGYALVRLVDGGKTAFFSRAGVLPWARGKQLQRRLIRARVRWARKAGCTTCVTYTMRWNAASAGNLIAEGFRPYWPAEDWGGDGACYWYKGQLQ